MSLNELFARDPLKIKDEELDVIVQQLREQRKNFDLGIKPAKAAKPKAASKGAAKDAAPKGEISLEGLGLDEPAEKPDPKNVSLDDLGL